MNLSDQQKQTIRDWVAAGASLSDVQRKLKAELGISMMYIDVRLLVLDLGAAVQDKPEAVSKKQPPRQPQPRDEADISSSNLDEEMDTEGLAQDEGMPEGQEGTGGTVSMTMDTLVIPGAMVSGTVTFSDETTARWFIDQQGRFGVDPDTPGYRPSPEDMQAFQMQLRSELQRKGYA